MSALIIPPAGGRARPGSWLCAIVAARTLVEDMTREWELRRAIRKVGTLDEAVLHDLGLTAGGIEHAVRRGRGGRDGRP